MGDQNHQSASPADTEEQDVTTSAAASTAEDENLDSSPEGSKSETEETLSDVIGKAMSGEDDGEGDGESEKTGEEEGGEKPESESEEGEEPEDPDKKKAETAEEDDDGSDLKEGQKIPYNRFKKVIDQRNGYKEKVQTIEQERDQYRKGHENFQAIDSFMRDNKLQVGDVTQALQIAAAINNNPAEAAKMLTPIYQQLQQYTGEILPEDLQQRVDTGELSSKDAQEIVRTRNENQRLTRQQTEDRAQQQRREQEGQIKATQLEMSRSADKEQARIKASDPDYEKKSPLIRDRLALLIQQKQPRSAKEAETLVREAHQYVTEQLSRAVSRPESRPGPSSSQGGRSSTAAAEPQTMEEAIQAALR